VKAGGCVLGVALPASVGLVARSRVITSAGGLGWLGSFIVHAAIWHIVGQGVSTLFRRFPALGAVAAVLMVAVGVYLLVRWASRRGRARQHPYDQTGRGPQDW